MCRTSSGLRASGKDIRAAPAHRLAAAQRLVHADVAHRIGPRDDQKLRRCRVATASRTFSTISGASIRCSMPIWWWHASAGSGPRSRSPRTRLPPPSRSCGADASDRPSRRHHPGSAAACGGPNVQRRLAHLGERQVASVNRSEAPSRRRRDTAPESPRRFGQPRHQRVQHERRHHRLRPLDQCTRSRVQMPSPISRRGPAPGWQGSSSAGYARPVLLGQCCRA